MELLILYSDEKRKGKMTCPGHETNNYQAWYIILGLSDSTSLHPTKLCLEDFFIMLIYYLHTCVCMWVQSAMEHMRISEDNL